MSNPSPRLIDRAATAFRDGTYVEDNGVRFGAGQYGDLAAMVAALLLDRESRAVVLDVDPSHGSLQEPLLRLVRIMRSLEFELKEEKYFIRLKSELHDLIGQAPHELPTVFSFFLPEHKPAGECCLAFLFYLLPGPLLMLFCAVPQVRSVMEGWCVRSAKY